MLETVVKRLRERSRGYLVFLTSLMGMIVANSAFARIRIAPTLTHRVVARPNRLTDRFGVRICLL